jgi:gas vesicle protein
MAIIKGLSSRANPQKLVNYLTNEEKTEEKLISGKDCSPENIVREFRATKELYGKTDGIQYHHMIQSFSPKDNITPEKAHELGIEIAEKQFKGHEVFVVTHKDKEHIHNHLVINSVSFENGKKYQSNRNSMIALKRASNRQCEREGLITLDIDHKALQRVSTGEKRIEMKGGIPWKDELRQCIDFAKERTKNLKEFKTYLEKNFEINARITNKTISYQHPDKIKPIRGSKLGADYDKEELEIEFIRQEERIRGARTRKASRTKGDREQRSVDWSAVAINVKNEGSGVTEQFGDDITGAIQQKVRDVKERTERAIGISKPKDRGFENKQRHGARNVGPRVGEPKSEDIRASKVSKKHDRKRDYEIER